jgi:FkbM family methyltransferase
MFRKIGRFSSSAAHRFELALFRPYQITKYLEDERLELWIDSLVSKKWYDRQHDWVELKWLKEFAIKQGDLVADVGAHTGLTSLLFSRWAGKTGRVIAFEASPKNHAALVRNIQLNQAQNIEAVHAAVSSERGAVTISTHPNASVLSDKTRGATQTVPSTSLDSFFSSHGRYPTFLKIDVEGHEEEVLLGAKEVLRRNPSIDIEIHCVLFEPSVRAAKVERLLNLLNIKRKAKACFIQLNVDGEIVPFQEAHHTPSLIARHEVVHFLAIS